ncbi:hypothetical protein [uncultured Methanoregula sp.]|uniref:hypothetical protein n=1 Tax=uncultured Methanoregula sp. TaxID=1005933 RepID=UPI002AAADCCD|nr:hypothetical protein [uncultured Methanoregula sp.]
MITHLIKNIQHRFGWCPNTRMIKTAPVMLSTPPAFVLPSGQAGGAGGQGRIGRGIELVAGSIRTLTREKQLLWFSVLTGLVIAFMFLAQYTLHVLGSYPYEMISDPAWMVLTYAIGLSGIFCFSFLLSGLVLNLSPEDPKKDQSIREGLSEAGKYLRPLLTWSAILAVAGTGIYLLFRSAGELTIDSLINRFPFGYIVEPEAYGTGPIAGGFHIMYAADATFMMMIITLFLFAITAFIVPALVLEKKSIPGAIGESARLIRKSWGEMLVCFLILGTALIAFTALSWLFQMLFYAVELNGPFWYEFYYKGGWRVVAALYMAAWMIFALAGATIAGIAIRDLYTYAKTGRMPGSHETLREVQSSP